VDKDHFAASYFLLKAFRIAFAAHGNIIYTTNESYSLQQNVNPASPRLSAKDGQPGMVTFTELSGGRVNSPGGVGLDDLGSKFTTRVTSSLPFLNVSGYFTAGGSFAGPITVTDFYLDA